MMLTTPQLGAKGVASLRQSRSARRSVCVAAQSKATEQDAAAVGRRNFLAALGLISTLTAAQSASAATDAYEEMRSITASRTGSESLLDKFDKTRSAVASTKADRGIREKLAAGAANTPQPAATSSSSSGFKLSAPKPAAPAPKPVAPKPLSSGPKPFSSSSGPKPAAPKPASPKPAGQSPKPAAPKPATPAAAAPAAAAGSGAGFGGAIGPIAQAIGVLGVVSVGANAVTNFATSNSESKARKAAATPAAPAAAAAPAPAGTRKISAGKPSSAASPASSAAKAASAAAAAAGSTVKVAVKKVPAKAGAQAQAVSGTVKDTIKQALVNEEKPEEPTDFAVAGFLGFAGLLAAFFLFGLPQPISTTPEGSRVSDPLVEEAKQAGSATSTAYTTPLFKSRSESVDASRRMIAASKAAPEVAAKPAPAAPKPAPAAPAAPAPTAVAPAVVAPKPAPAPAAPAPAAAPAKPAPEAPAAVQKAEEKKPVVPAPAKPAPTPAAPAAVKKVEEKQPAAAAAAEASSGPNNLLIVGGSLALIVAAFAAVGGSSESSTATTEASTSGAAPAAGAADGAATATPAVAEPVIAAASTAGAAAPAAPGATADNGEAAYEKAVNALFADPDTADELYAIIAPALRNGPALAWALVSNEANAETLDGWAFQKLSTPKYTRVRQLLVDMGLQLPETPKPQPILSGFAADDSEAAAQLDPEKLRSVFEALLANPASRTLMRKLLAGAGMPFNEEAFEEQIKDSTYFNLAIAPILRKMPPQKLAVLADLQDPVKLQELVNSVSSLAADNTQLDAVTAELSGDVRNTVEKIREGTRESSTTSSR